ncbi:MAG: ribosomal protein S18-alanine N-acetyltransferase [Nitrospirae bacterium]|nr:ribosomal protein S18-alanine N-acetyltransferase [Nitrospirota bacterium]
MQEDIDLSSITIEYMKKEDIDEVLKIEHASFSTPWSREMFFCELTDHPFSYLYVAKDEKKKILGYICYWLVFDEMNILNLAVDERYRQSGIGSSLLRFVLEDGADKGAQNVILEVRCSNIAALELYEKFGFRQVAVRKNYYDNPDEDALMMALEDISAYRRKERCLKVG